MAKTTITEYRRIAGVQSTTRWHRARVCSECLQGRRFQHRELRVDQRHAPVERRARGPETPSSESESGVERTAYRAPGSSRTPGCSKAQRGGGLPWRVRGGHEPAPVRSRHLREPPPLEKAGIGLSRWPTGDSRRQIFWAITAQSSVQAMADKERDD